MFSNFGFEIAVVVSLSFIVAQLIKVISYSIRRKQLYLKGFLESGGLPSGHSAVMASLTTMIYFEQGFSSLFFVSFFISLIVMYDAMGVRKEVEKHSKAIMLLADKVKVKGMPNLKEYVGHSIVEVFVGACLGVLIALIFML